jgi:hypothetical protein
MAVMRSELAIYTHILYVILFFLCTSKGGIAFFARKRCTTRLHSEFNIYSTSSHLRLPILVTRMTMTSNEGSKKNILKQFVAGRSSTAKLVSSAANFLPQSVEVKSLIWEYDGVPIIVVIDANKQVNVASLADYCGVATSTVALASRERAIQLGGFELGTLNHI